MDNITNDFLDALDVLIKSKLTNITTISKAVVNSVSDAMCNITINGVAYNNIAYYGVAPEIGHTYRLFVPDNNMSESFILVVPDDVDMPIASATQLGGIKVGAGLAISNSGTLSATGGGTADSVDWKNVQDKPTTISGYGITDAKISGNTIILGNGTMTPYTGNNPPPYPVTSVNGQTGDVTIDTGGNVDSVNGKTGDVVLDASDVGALPSTTVIPSKTSQLANDSGYVNQTQAKNAAPVQSVDGATGAVVTNAVKTTEQSLTDAQKQQARENIGAGTSSFDGDYNSLSNKPTIPTKVSQLENDSDYATESQVDAKYTKPTSGIPKSDLSSDVQTSLNKADTALQSAPVTSVNNKMGDVQLTATDVGALPDTTKIPSKTSDITNDSGYITEADVPVKSVNGKTGTVQLSASDVGALPDTTIIPSKTSDLTNDSGYITDIPIASKTQLGAVKIGAGLAVSSEGTISVTGGGTADAVEWSNVLDKPTTIGGYGITDAKIDDSTITLGDKSITPLTEAPVTSVNGYTGDVVIGDNVYIVNLTGVGTTSNPYKCDKTTAEIWTALGEGKNVYLYQANMRRYIPYVGGQGVQMAVFTCVVQSNVITFMLMVNGTVTSSTINVETTSRKVTTITSASTDTQYPSAKAVWNLVGSVGGVNIVTQEDEPTDIKVGDYWYQIIT